MRRISYFLVFFDLQPHEIVFCKEFFNGLEMHSEKTNLFVALKYKARNRIKQKLDFILENEFKWKIGFEFRMITTRYDSGFVLPAYVSTLMSSYGRTIDFSYKIAEYADSETGAVYDRNWCRIL